MLTTGIPSAGASLRSSGLGSEFVNMSDYNTAPVDFIADFECAVPVPKYSFIQGDNCRICGNHLVDSIYEDARWYCYHCQWWLDKHGHVVTTQYIWSLYGSCPRKKGNGYV